MSLELSTVLISFIIILNEELTILYQESFMFCLSQLPIQKESYNSNFTLKDVLSTDKTYLFMKRIILLFNGFTKHACKNYVYITLISTPLKMFHWTSFFFFWVWEKFSQPKLKLNPQTNLALKILRQPSVIQYKIMRQNQQVS